MNGETPPLDPVEEQKSEEQKQEEEKKKEEEEKKQEEASKSEHDGKYFVVHNAKCVCDKAVNPKQTADLQVTTHKIIVLNDQAGKFAATEDDKTFIPPAATFGQCKLKPTTGGYLPCQLAAAPKWTKTYDSTQVQGKNTLTEISELMCMIGGKITIDKHGQTDSVSNAHADNTNPLELAAVNPAIEQPKKKEEYPVVTSIAITKIEDRADFKEQNSKEKEKIYLRKNEEAAFKANLKSGNKQLTSWMVYSDHQGKKENRLFFREQVGTEFSQSFADLGKFRVEGYGKPKSPDYEKGKYDKCDASCSIDVEVVQNTLLDIEVTSGDFTMRKSGGKNKFRKGVPSVFKAKFFIQNLTEEENSRLLMSVTDGAGNDITDGVQKSGNVLTFTPQNTNAAYTITAKYTTENGEETEKNISGETEGNAVLAISHAAEVVRPGTSVTFNVTKMRYNFGGGNSDYDLTQEEFSEIKWNLNGLPLGTGKSITVPGSKLMNVGKYVVEAYSVKANATGKGSKDEEDDWRFEVKENDVLSFTLSGTPKVGRPVTATVDKMVFADLLSNEIIHWRGFSTSITGKSITITPKAPGNLAISCFVNNKKGVTQNITIVQPIINDIMFTDSGGNKIEKASWGQKVNIFIDQKDLTGEKINLVLWDDDSGSFDDPVKTISVNSYDGGLIPLALDAGMKTKTGNHGLIFGKLSVDGLTAKGEEIASPKKYKLDVEDRKEIYSALLGSADGKEKHTIVDYDEISYFYAHTRGIKPSETLYLQILDSVLGNDTKLLYANNVKVDESGAIKEKIVWNNIKKKVNLLTVYAMVREKNADGKVLYDADGNFSMATAKLKKGSTLTKIAGYTSAVKVGSQNIQGTKEESKCPRCEEEITLKIIEEAFQVYSKQKDFREKIVASLNKFIKQRKSEGKDLHLNTCLRKAHFFAQVAVETLGIHGDWIIEGNINHSVTSAKNAFGDRAKTLESRGLLSGYCSDRPQERLLNYMYAKGNGFDNGNGVESTGDGWKFRGRGLKQITGRDNYNMISTVLKDIFPAEYDKLPKANHGEEKLESHPEKVEEIDYAVTTAIAFWEKHAIWELADKIPSKTSSDNDFKSIRQKVVGKSGFKWKVTKDYFQKTYDAFKVKDCQKDSNGNSTAAEGDYNLYKTDYIKKTYTKAMTSESKTYKFEVYKNGVLEKSYTLEKSEHGYFNFPESGINWGRYGTRDASKSIGGDNWANEECVAALLGFFYSVKESGLTETLYYNDISSHDGKTNLGHSTHKTGKDVDIRYPGCTNAAGEQLWTVAKNYWGSETKLDEIMQKIYKIAIEWDFVNNYQYKTVVNASRAGGHENHFHIGLK
ncbi:DUF4280 domain-containing protein [Chryseobacterium sp. C-2]|nr:DUF4280 domain-containing protein [Chryseobacterium muglaense]